MTGRTCDPTVSIIIRGEQHVTSQVDFSRKIAIGVGAFKSQGPKHDDRHRVVKQLYVRDWKVELKIAY